MSAHAWRELISVDQILGLHSRGLEQYGGAEGLREGEACVEGATGNAWSAALYAVPPGEDCALAFAASILKTISAAHCFVDGNKRVAWSTAMAILASKNLTVTATEDEAYSFVIKIIEEHLERDAIFEWLTERLVWLH